MGEMVHGGVILRIDSSCVILDRRGSVGQASMFMACDMNWWNGIERWANTFEYQLKVMVF